MLRCIAPGAIVVVLLCSILAASKGIRAEETVQAIKAQLEQAVQQSDWHRRENVIRTLRTGRLSEFDTDEEMLDLTWSILMKEVDLIQEDPEILYENKEYRQHFETLVRLIALHQKRARKYDLPPVLVTLPYWYEETFRVIANEGGEKILPQLLKKLTDTSSGRQDLRDGILAITYTNIARGTYSKEYIQTLKEIYLRFLSDEAFRPNDSSLVKDFIRKRAITGLGVIGDKDVLPELERFLHDLQHEQPVVYHSATGITGQQQAISHESLSEEIKRVIEILKRDGKHTLEDITNAED